MDTSILRAVCLVPEMPKIIHSLQYLYNMDTSARWTLGSVPLVSVLKRFDCIWKATKLKSLLSWYVGRDPFNQNSDRSDWEKRTTSKGGPVFSKLFRLDRTDPLSFGPKFPEILVEWIAPVVFPPLLLKKGQVNYLNSKGIKAANLDEGQLCKWHLEIHVVSFISNRASLGSWS